MQIHPKGSLGGCKIRPQIIKRHRLTGYIWFCQDKNWLQGCVAVSEELQGDELILFTDSNWGPRDL